MRFEIAMELGLLLAGSFFLGSLPFGLWIGRALGVDIRKVGSGNIGATNAMRALGKGWGLLVLVLDVLKGLVPALVGRFLFDDAQIGGLCGLTAVLGHCLSPFLRFRGGKGISTGLGALLGSTPLVGFSAFVVFAIILWRTRYVSLASMAAAFALIPFGLLFGDPLTMVSIYAAFFAFVVYRHRANIDRLRSGTENRFEWKRSSSGQEAAT